MQVARASVRDALRVARHGLVLLHAEHCAQHVVQLVRRVVRIHARGLRVDRAARLRRVQHRVYAPAEGIARHQRAVLPRVANVDEAGGDATAGQVAGAVVGRRRCQHARLGECLPWRHARAAAQRSPKRQRRSALGRAVAAVSCVRQQLEVKVRVEPHQHHGGCLRDDTLERRAQRLPQRAAGPAAQHERDVRVRTIGAAV